MDGKLLSSRVQGLSVAQLLTDETSWPVPFALQARVAPASFLCRLVLLKASKYNSVPDCGGLQIRKLLPRHKSLQVVLETLILVEPWEHAFQALPFAGATSDMQQVTFIWSTDYQPLKVST